MVKTAVVAVVVIIVIIAMVIIVVVAVVMETVARLYIKRLYPQTHSRPLTSVSSLSSL